MRNNSSLFSFILSSSSIFCSFNFSNSASISLVFKVKRFSFNPSISVFKTLYSLFISLISRTINAISIFSNSPLISLYFLATILCSFKGSTVLDNSVIISLILVKFSSVFSNFFNDSSFLFLYFNTPAALSKITRRSLDLLLTISVTLPCEIILNALDPAPESIKRSVISLSLTRELFIKYSFSPVE